MQHEHSHALLQTLLTIPSHSAWYLVVAELRAKRLLQALALRVQQALHELQGLVVERVPNAPGLRLPVRLTGS